MISKLTVSWLQTSYALPAWSEVTPEAKSGSLPKKMLMFLSDPGSGFPERIASATNSSQYSSNELFSSRSA